MAIRRNTAARVESEHHAEGVARQEERDENEASAQYAEGDAGVAGGASQDQEQERRESRPDEPRAGDSGGGESAEAAPPERDSAGIRVQPERLEATAKERRGQPVSQFVRQRRHEDERPGDRAAERDRIQKGGDEHADRENARRAIGRPSRAQP